MYKKKNLLPVLSLACALIALVLSVIALLSGGAGPDRSYENPALEQQVQALQAQVDALTAQLEGVAADTGLADWNLSAAAWADGAGADVTLTILPEAYTEGMELVFRVELDGQEAARETCTREEGGFTATVSLPAADGYGYYCLLLSPDGGEQQLCLTSPENPTDEHLVALQSSLSAYCIMTVEDWKEADGELVISSGAVEVQLPLIGGGSAIESAHLILTLNGEETGRVVLNDLPDAPVAQAFLSVSDVRFPIPEMSGQDYLELTLEVTLPGGQTISAPAAGWYPGADGLNIIVG